MTAVMDLVAGDTREILLAITVEDWAGLSDRSRFDAHLSLGGGLDPTWLDLFAEAARSVTGAEQPQDFLEARQDLEGQSDIGDRTVERVDPAWIAAVAGLSDGHLDAIAGRWIDLLAEELGDLPGEEKPWIRTLVTDLVQFARAANGSPAVIFAWSL
ncbi:MAG TPA: hypothetical protein VM344_04785 [Vitreimonas sp.]|nr:hypothetical protein [Vitreimonas sp.]